MCSTVFSQMIFVITILYPIHTHIVVFQSNDKNAFLACKTRAERKQFLIDLVEADSKKLKIHGHALCWSSIKQLFGVSSDLISAVKDLNHRRAASTSEKACSISSGKGQIVTNFGTNKEGTVKFFRYFFVFLEF